ncbi:hypothetical protein AWC38_SpisGene10892 [Stylophora pistillata]|uniref:Uncharacterized protein n=1 Tax=Stylophora pistillata TaxID=50429 RepID=A0A2B4S6U4_STYPI|nr:hypothetical protein AWC38_SpisGene10892 [Stylophora pistillata]
MASLLKRREKNMDILELPSIQVPRFLTDFTDGTQTSLALSESTWTLESCCFISIMMINPVLLSLIFSLSPKNIHALIFHILSSIAAMASSDLRHCPA